MPSKNTFTPRTRAMPSHLIDQAINATPTQHSPCSAPPNTLPAEIAQALADLDSGQARVAQPVHGEWVVNKKLKEAILESFRHLPNQIIHSGDIQHYDKCTLKFQHLSEDDWAKTGIRCVPGAIVRYGSYIAPGCVLMPSFINIGAYIDQNCMIDTWATVGSCAQLGKRVHLSGGAGIGGVLEPLQAQPTIIEDDCFIGARSEIVEGVIVETGAVIAMGVYISQSTPIYDRSTDTITYGRIPSGAVVIPGTIPGSHAGYQKAAAIIVKQVDRRTREKVGINQLLREATS